MATPTTTTPARPTGNTGLAGNSGFGGSTGPGSSGGNPLRGPTGTDEAQKHSEGPVAAGIEYYTAQMPSDWFLWAGGASILASLTLQVLGRKDDAQFVGHWAPTFLILGLYNKIVKVAGTDRVRQQG